MDEFTELLELARGGDQDAMGELLERHRDRLREVASRELGQDVQVRADASDVVQQTILSAFRKFPDFAGSDEKQLRAWLERILQRNVRDTVRSHVGAKKRTILREASLGLSGAGDDGLSLRAAGEGGMAAVTRGENTEWLMTQMEALPPDQGLAVRMRHLEGKGLEDVAVIMGRSKLAVASLIKRGLETLRQRAQTQTREDQ